MEEGAWRIKEVGKVVVEGEIRGKTKDTREQRERERGARVHTRLSIRTCLRVFLFSVAARRIAAEGQDRVNLPLVVYRSQYSVV